VSSDSSHRNPDYFKLDQKIIIVTGGLGQLGRQYTRALCQYGARVVVLDLFLNENDNVKEYFPELSKDRLKLIQCDITSKESLVSALEKIKKDWGSPFGLINNAALDSPPSAPAEENGPFEEYPLESFEKVLKVNTTGTFLACQVFGAEMARQGRGTIVNIGSIYGEVSPNQTIYKYKEEEEGRPFFKPVAYSASKSSLKNLTKYLATYWAPNNVRVNLLTLAGVFNHQDSKFLEQYQSHMPLGRMANEDEYNGAVVFLMSEASKYMTGSNMIIDGGWTAW
jgi:NAD(P)-dependent dehydrogenase (short-subunit alcohol dehydrogenase family)